MAKRITVEQLKSAISRFPREVKTEGQIFLIRGLAEYKKVAVGSAPWRIGQSGGGVPVRTGNLKENHRTMISGLEGKFGVGNERVPYARRVYYGFNDKDSLGRKYNQKARPWLDYARNRANTAVEKHYKVFMDNILKFLAN